ncbi:MAG: hypothetical protein K940chlam2_01394 [Chlamydiae bacterium]|nr:hypothetical protein [Chlamydiota bacterium]
MSFIIKKKLFCYLAFLLLGLTSLVPRSYSFDKKMGQDFLSDRRAEIEANLNKVSEIEHEGQPKKNGADSCQNYVNGVLEAREDHLVENQPAALEKALTLCYEGVLRQKENGFVYLDVSNEFVTEVTPLLELPGQLRVPPTSSRSVGAHISVFYEKEDVIPEELDEKFSFDVNEVRSFTMHTRDGLKKLWVLAVHSPELEMLRERNGCVSKLNGHDFHITLGKQMPAAAEGWENVEAISALNYEGEPTRGLESEGDFVTVEMDDVQEVLTDIAGLGQLHLKNNGFVYLDVSNEFVTEITPLLPLEGSFTPLPTKAKQMGAHISVIHEDEMIGKQIWSLEEAGEWFTFEPKALRYVDRKTSSGAKRLWLLAADAPGLERLRTQYGLKPKLQGHDFHITLGCEEIISSENTQEEELEECA